VVLLLAMVLPAWLAALVIGAAVLIMAGVTALVGRAQLRKAAPPVPDRTVASVREDLAMIRQRAHPVPAPRAASASETAGVPTGGAEGARP
jgi:Putative Actinobacterial Holin-X, holin superfamily III